MAGLMDVTRESFKTAFRYSGGNLPTWIGMTVLTAVIAVLGTFYPIIPNFSFLLTIGIILIFCILNGIYVKSLRLEQPSFSHIGKTMLSGFIFSCLSFIYTVVPMLLVAVIFYCLHLSLGFLEEYSDIVTYHLSLGFSIVLSVLILAIFTILWIPACVRFAKSGKFRDAFKINSLLTMIETLSWKKSVLGVLWVVVLEIAMMAAITGICYVLSLIPYAGIYLALIIGSAAVVFTFIFISVYAPKLFEGVMSNE